MKVNIYTSAGRKELFTKTKKAWEDQGFTVNSIDNTGKSCGYGRNHFLKEFYKSDEEWCLIVDDDVNLIPKMNDTRFFIDHIEEVLHSVPENIVCINPFRNKLGIIEPDNGWFINDEYDDNWVYTAKECLTGNLIFIRNTAAPTLFDEVIIMQDVDFSLQLVERGFHLAVLANVFMHEYASTQTSLEYYGANKEIADKKNIRLEAEKKAALKILEMHPKIRKITDDGNFGYFDVSNIVDYSDGWTDNGKQGIQKYVNKRMVIINEKAKWTVLK